MKKNSSEIACIIDKSGSMFSLTEDTIGGFNSFLKSQKEITDRDITVSLTLFDTNIESCYTNLSINEVPLLNSDTYSTGGMTALNDAIGITIQSLGKKLSKMNESERPERVIFVILTDGEENSSQEYDSDKIKEMIKHQEEKYNWEFIFLGANQDSFRTGQLYGFSNDKIANFDFSDQGMKKVFGTMTSYCNTPISNKSVQDIYNSTDIE